MAIDWKAEHQVVIVGAGLVGLALAIFLRRAGYPVTLLERDPELRNIGAGVQLPATHNKVLDELGLLDEVCEHSVFPQNIILHKYTTGQELAVLPLWPDIKEKYGAPHLVIHRHDLRTTLANEAQKQGAITRLGFKIDAIKSDFGKGYIVSVDGEEVKADLVIGADGEHSMCREALLGHEDPPRPIGRLSNRIVIDSKPILEDPSIKYIVDPPNIRTWLGPGCQALTYLMHDQINIVFNTPMGNDPIFYGPKPVDMEGMKAFIKDWDPNLRRLLDIGKGYMKWVSLETNLLKDWVHPDGKFVLIGDAAHATLPYLGQGAAIGMESASVLSTLLSRAPSPHHLPHLLHLYNTLRQRRTELVRRASRKMGDTWHMYDGPLADERDKTLLEEGDAPTAGHPFLLMDPHFQEWLWAYDPPKEAEKAYEEWEQECATVNGYDYGVSPIEGLKGGCEGGFGGGVTVTTEITIGR